MLYKHEGNPQENNHAEVQSQQSYFATSMKSHQRTDAPSKIRSTPAEYLYLGEDLWGPASVKRVLKDLNYKKLLFTVLQRNLLTLKNKKVNK